MMTMDVYLDDLEDEPTTEVLDEEQPFDAAAISGPFAAIAADLVTAEEDRREICPCDGCLFGGPCENLPAVKKAPNLTVPRELVQEIETALGTDRDSVGPMTIYRLGRLVLLREAAVSRRLGAQIAQQTESGKALAEHEKISY